MLHINLITRVCPKHGNPLSARFFRRKANGTFNRYCKKCCEKSSSIWLATNRRTGGRYYTLHRQRLQRVKLEVIHEYGGACACCGESRLEFLVIDHIGGGGNKHRKDIGINSGTGFMLWLKRHRFPSGFRVLCHNCNFAIAHGKPCPHQIGVDLPLYEASEAIMSYLCKLKPIASVVTDTHPIDKILLSHPVQGMVN